MISFVSMEFLAFVGVTLLLYFWVPARYRWLVLLGSSIYFYFCSGAVQLLVVLGSTGIAYGTALRVEKIHNSDNPDRKEARKHLTSGILLLLFILAYAKVGRRAVVAAGALLGLERIDFEVLVPLGISYYSFSLIGYMADVYWKKDKAEHSYLKLLLYMIYFPHILQGPIPRHRRLAPWLIEGHPFDYRGLCHGLQRMMWGYFKKMVIADRLALLVGTVFDNPAAYGGPVFVIGAVCAAVQLYCDFSGCMDIALGISEAMSIRLDENFQRPFFARSAAEFWRRWHITLGTWFKDYVYMPLAISPRLIRFSQRAKGRFGNRTAKNLMSVIPLAIVWLLTGLWHSTGMNYVVWGLYWGILIILGTVLAPEIKKLTKRLGINTESKWFKSFQVVRTFVLYLISRLLTAPGDIRLTGEIFRRMLTGWDLGKVFTKTIFELGLDGPDLAVAVLAVCVLWCADLLQERGVRIRERIEALPLAVRWGIFYICILTIFIFGVYGSGEDTFVYMFY